MPYLISALGCSLALSGPIDAMMVDRVSQIKCPAPTVKISTPGGEAEDAFRLLDALRKVKAELQIHDVCSSACAEIILPLYSKIVVEPGTLIAVHGNPMTKRFLALHYQPPGIEYCTFPWAQRIEVEYKNARLNAGFWKWQLKVMPLQEFIVQSDAKPFACPTFSMRFAHTAIALTKKQLSENLGLNIKVPTCADSKYCIGRKSAELKIRLLVVN